MLYPRRVFFCADHHLKIGAFRPFQCCPWSCCHHRKLNPMNPCRIRNGSW